MKCILAGIVVLSMVSMIYCIDDPCSAPTDAEMKCFNGKDGRDVAQSCKAVNFTALQQGDVQRSKVCSVPDCITALDKDIYTPCSRSDLTACLKSVCANCTNVSDDEMKCMVSAANRSADELTKRCAGVDMKRLTKDVKDLMASQLCHHPSCISALRENVYEPCKRGDLAPCILHFCNTGGTCPAVTADQLHCINNAESTNGDLITTYCNGVDIDLLKAEKILESKICDHPECLTTLDKALFIPCQRSDLGGCVLQVCGGKCSAATAQEMKCMTDAATKHVADFEADCYDINFVDLQNKEFKKSGICDNPGCLLMLDKFLYAPCNRSDLAPCVRVGCDCSPLSSDELKCMTNAFVKNENELKTPCKGVDFALLQRGDIADSELCDHPECTKALTTYVYTPCKIPDVQACLAAGCSRGN